MLLYVLMAIAVLDILAVAMGVEVLLRGLQLERRRKKLAGRIALSSHLTFGADLPVADGYLDAAFRCLHDAGSALKARNHAKARLLLESGEENTREVFALLAANGCPQKGK